MGLFWLAQLEPRYRVSIPGDGNLAEFECAIDVTIGVKSIVRTLVASASLDGDDLTLVPNYPGITGVKMASPRGFEPRSHP